MENPRFGPVIALRGSHQDSCEFTFTDLGIEASFVAPEGFRTWNAVIPWHRTFNLSVTEDSNGALLTVNEYRFRFPRLSAEELRMLIGTPLPKLAADFWGPDDPPPAGPFGDVSFEDRSGGGEIWFGEWLAEDYRYLVGQSVVWLKKQPGVESVLAEDPNMLVIDGRFDASLKSDVSAWWIERVDGLNLI